MEPITYKGTVYTASAVTVDAAEEIFETNQGKGRALNRALVAATFGLAADTIGALDFPLYSQLIDQALEVNGLKPKGETQAAGPASTSA